MYAILHVDNSSFFKTILMKATDRSHFSLVSVPNPEKAFDLLRDKQFDLIITGLEFEGMSGLEFIHYLNKSTHRDTVKVILTSNDSVELRKKAELLGVRNILQKDISLNSLYTFIELIKNIDIIKTVIKKIQVAVFEPNEESAEQITQLLLEEGFKGVTHFNNLENFLLRDQDFFVYIINFLDFTSQIEREIISIKKHNINAIVIAISEKYDSEDIVNIMLAGADDFVIKPLNSKLFMARINAHIRLQIHLDDIQLKNLQLEKVNLVLNRMVITDGLTSLFNRTFTMESLELGIANAERYKSDLSIVMFDIDHFKKVNDTYGHQIGDLVLVELSKLIQLNTRKGDIVGRYGGEEFLIILPETGLENGKIISEKIRKLVENYKFDIEGLKVTISCGLCTRKNEKIEEFINKADELLYKAKKLGRNQTAF